MALGFIKLSCGKLKWVFDFKIEQGFEECDRGDGAIAALSSSSSEGFVLIDRDLKDTVPAREPNGAPPSELHVLKV